MQRAVLIGISSFHSDSSSSDSDSESDNGCFTTSLLQEFMNNAPSEADAALALQNELQSDNFNFAKAPAESSSEPPVPAIRAKLEHGDGHDAGYATEDDGCATDDEDHMLQFGF